MTVSVISISSIYDMIMIISIYTQLTLPSTVLRM